ncbi:MAG: TorF family putative porin [Pseudomonadota bacterium]
MKQSLALAMMLSAVSGGAAAGDAISVSSTLGYESRYIFRGVQFAETSIQPSVQLSYGGFYGGAWFNLPIGDDDLVVTPGGEELDLFVGYSASVNDVVAYDVGITYYTFPDLASGFLDVFEEDGDGLGANTVEVYAGLSLTAPLSPTLYVYRDFMFDTFTIEGGVSHSVPLMTKTSLNLGGSIGYVVDDDAGGDYLYGAATADISYALTDIASVSAGGRFGGSDIAGGSFINDAIAGTTQSNGFWWGLSLSASF